MKKRNIIPLLLIIFSSSVFPIQAIEKLDNPLDNKDSTFTDIGVDNIFAGKQFDCNFRLREIITVVRNYGTKPVSNFDVQIYDDGVLITTQTTTEILYPGNYFDICFYLIPF